MFSSLLPPPKHSAYDPSQKVRFSKSKDITTSSQLIRLPTGAKTQVINNPNDADGTISKLHLNPDGTLNYDQTIASSNSQYRQVQASYEDTIPLKKRFPNLKHHFPRYTLETCPDDTLKNCIDETRSFINGLLGGSSQTISNESEVTYVNYESNSIVNNEDTQESRGRIIQIRQFQEDPMLPPKFKLRKNRHKDPSPPPPILKNTNASETKLTKEDREKWNIPAAISNWKNNQGFTLSLDKRIIAANGGSSAEAPDVNLEKFGDLSSALESADKEAREEIKVRNELMKEMAIQEKQDKEQKLRELAEITRNERQTNYNRATKRPNYDNDRPPKRTRH